MQKRFNFSSNGLLEINLSLNATVNILQSKDGTRYLDLEINAENGDKIKIEESSNFLKISHLANIELSDFLHTIVDVFSDKKTSAIKHFEEMAQESIPARVTLFTTIDSDLDLKLNSGVVVCDCVLNGFKHKQNSGKFQLNKACKIFDLKMNNGLINLNADKTVDKWDIKMNNGSIEIKKSDFTGSIIEKNGSKKIQSTGLGNKYIELKINNGNVIVV